MKVTVLMVIYLFLAVLGFVIPVYFNFLADWTSTENPWWKPIFEYPVMSSFTADLMIGASAATLFIVSEGRRLKMKRIWLYVLLTFTVAFAFSLPLFLFIREKHLQRKIGF